MATSGSTGGPTVGEIGEHALIERSVAGRVQPGTTLLGPGDDAALVAAADGRVVVSTDVLVQGVHFRTDWSTPEQVGRKAVAQNAADVAAMGARTTALLVGLAAPAATPVAFTDGLTAGLWSAASAIGAGVVGGDVVRAEQVVVSITALGDLEGRDPVLRSGARPGDVLALAGRQGWSAAGLAVLGRGFRAPAAVVSAHRVPEPPLAAGVAAAVAGATAMTDVSDGLVADALALAVPSGVAIDLHRAALEPDAPLRDVAAALGGDPWTWVLTGGEDHGMLATFPAGAALPSGFRAVGTVRTGHGVSVDGEPWSAADAGWTSFGS
ncbi:thiamine-phosphate kinase [Rhodococcus aerolatus]